MTKLNEWCCAYINLIFLNMLWVSGAILGLGIFGIFPASVAISQIYQKYQRDMIAVLNFKEITREYFIRYKREFLISNRIALYFYFITLFLYIDYALLRQASDTLSVIVNIFLVILIFITIMVFLIISTIYNKFELKPYRYIFQSYLLLCCSPLVIVKLTAMLLIIFVLFNFIPLFILPVYFSVQLKIINDIMLKKFSDLNMFYHQSSTL